MSRVIIHVDMDAFYASIEQRDNPEYRGKPLIIGGKSRRGVVSTASYEARKYGIHSAMPITKAYQLCPQAIFLSPNIPKYKKTSQEIMQIFHNFTPLVEPLSLDEAFLDVTNSQRLFGSPQEIARKIKEKIKDTLGLTCSIGIAENKFLAKMASDMRKPDGIFIIKKEETAEKIWPLPVQKLWGVGPKIAEVLAQINIKTIGELAQCEEDLLFRKLGAGGRDLHKLARGIDERPVEAYREPKSIGQEITFAKDTNNQEELVKCLLDLSSQVGRRLRKSGYQGKTISLKIRFNNFKTLNRSHTLNFYTDRDNDIYAECFKLFKNNYISGTLLRLLGVTVSNLIKTEENNQQLAFFTDKQVKDKHLYKILDNINSKYGQGTIFRARLMDNE